ncbi:putative peptidoglycan-binding domain-containing protein [Vibrio sp.]|uniref:putative peptidoglycan-binding domain-containing protein n=1 Tax=Vibrio sp. TaxID=678 RepID=UPI003AA9AEC7
MIYDWTITSGGAGKQVQKLLKDKYNKNISIDGVIGVDTINTINSISDQITLLKNLAEIRKDYYRKLVLNKPSNSVFLKGWLNRVNDCLEAVI